MQYTSVTTTSFFGSRKRSSGTTAATHAATASVSYDVPVTAYSVPIVNGWYRIFAYFTGVTNVMWFVVLKLKKQIVLQEEVFGLIVINLKGIG